MVDGVELPVVQFNLFALQNLIFFYMIHTMWAYVVECQKCPSDEGVADP